MSAHSLLQEDLISSQARLGETVQHPEEKGKIMNEGNDFQNPTGEKALYGLIGMKMVALS